MKLRHGFVSNSSSTSFTFIFKGKSVEDLCAILPNYESHFRLRYEMWSFLDNDVREVHRCDVNDIIDSLKSVVKERPDKDDYYTVYAQHIDEVIQDLEEELESAKERLSKQYAKEDRHTYLDNHYRGYVDEIIIRKAGKKAGAAA